MVLLCEWDMDVPSQISGQMCHKLFVKVLSFQVLTFHLEPDLESFKLIFLLFFSGGIFWPFFAFFVVEVVTLL